MSRAQPFFLVPLMILASASLVSAAQSPVAATCPPTAQPPSPVEIAKLAKNAQDHGFLWKATKGGKTSYLYGTIHVGRTDWMFPGPTTMNALRGTDAIALELDMMDPDIMQRLQAGMAPRPGLKLPAKLDERLKTQLKAACLPDQLAQVLSPEMLAMTLTSLVGRKDGLDPSFAVDSVYAGLGRGLNKPVSSLEAPELQVELLVGNTPAETEEMVDSALDELERGTAAPMLKRMAQAWADGRLGEIESYEQWCDCVKTDKDRESMKKLLNDRNPGMAKGIDALHSAGTAVFAAVGSLHMVGKRGLPALLAERGYVVERVEFKP